MKLRHKDEWPSDLVRSRIFHNRCVIIDSYKMLFITADYEQQRSSVSSLSFMLLPSRHRPWDASNQNKRKNPFSVIKSNCAVPVQKWIFHELKLMNTEKKSQLIKFFFIEWKRWVEQRGATTRNTQRGTRGRPVGVCCLIFSSIQSTRLTSRSFQTIKCAINFCLFACPPPPRASCVRIRWFAINFCGARRVCLCLQLSEQCRISLFFLSFSQWSALFESFVISLNSASSDWVDKIKNIDRKSWSIELVIFRRDEASFYFLYQRQPREYQH